ncbi:MAG: type II toxin-antitoxin system RelE/ParE family toxin [Acidobacteriota bacterium]
MDFKVVFTETFCCDLEDILEHIAAHDPMAARRLGDRVIDMCEALSFFPERYPKVRRRPNIRRLVVGKYYRVFYRIKQGDRVVEILRLWDGRRGSNPHFS